MMTNNSTSRMIREMLVCGCALSSLIAATAWAGSDRQDDANRRTAVSRSDRRPSQDMPAERGESAGPSRRGRPNLFSGSPRDNRSSSAGSSRGLLGNLFGRNRDSSTGSPGVAPRSSGGSPSRGFFSPRNDSNRGAGSPTRTPWTAAPNRAPFGTLANGDTPDRQGRGPTRTVRPDSPRIMDTPRAADTPRAPVAPRTMDTPRRAPQVSDVPDRRGPVANAPDRGRPTFRNDSNNVTAAPGRQNSGAPVFRSGSPSARGQGDQPVARSRDDVAHSIARPSTATDRIPHSQAPQGETFSRTPNTPANRDYAISRPGSDFGRTRPGVDAPVTRSRNDVAQSIARPSTGVSRIGSSQMGIGRQGLGTLSRPDATRGTTSANRSVPISRALDGISRSPARTPTNVGRSMTRTTTPRTIPDIARTPHGIGSPSRAASSGALAGRTGIQRGTDLAGQRSALRTQNSLRTASALRSNGTVRTAAFHDSRTVARGTVAGHGVEVRTARDVHHKDIYVINAGRFHPDHWPHGDYRPYHGGWHHDDWHHGDWHEHHHWAVDFTFVHSYFAPAGVVMYDVVPVAPVYPVSGFGFSFAYGHHVAVAFSSVRYVEPVVFAPPAVVVYPTYYVPPVIEPVVYTPVVPAPVVAPVPVPVVTPVYAPMYYYYPAYAYYPVYAAVAAPAYVAAPAPAPVIVEPAPVVAAPVPAVVETPASGWSIGTAFSFLGHHGHGFGFGATFSKVKPATVVTPAVAVAPAPAVAPADQVAPADGSVPAPTDGSAQAAPAGDYAQASDPQAAQQAAPTEDALESGLAAIRGGNMQQARAILDQYVTSDPDNGMARMLYSAALMADGQYKEAAESLRRSLHTWPDFQLKDFYLPAVYDNPKLYTQVTRDVREFLSDHPERMDAWLLVAWSYAVSGQSDEALSLLNEAKKSWPDDSALAMIEKTVQANEAAEQAAAKPTPSQSTASAQ